MRITIIPILAACVSSTLGTGLHAQVPPNHAVIGTVSSKITGGASGTSGLFYLSLKDGKTTRVTGLPSIFTRSARPVSAI